MDLKRPRLRQLDVFPQTRNGRTVIMIRDPEGITDQVAALEPPLAQFLFERLDGTRTKEEVAEELSRLSGGRIELDAILEQLDKAYFLESPRFLAQRATVLNAYREAPDRPAMSAGSSYPEDPEEAAAFFDDLYDGVVTDTAGPGLRALAVPHLDLRYGGRVAARGLAGLGERFDGETVVVLGVGHNLGRLPFAVTGKTYATPLGPVPVDIDLFRRVVEKAGTWVLEEELQHRYEHSAEFAAVLLRHALPDRDLKILPVLCGSFHAFVEGGREPAGDPLVGAFLETLAEEAGDALILASVDLAHMGPFYGDPAPLGEADIQRIEAGDREMLARMEAGDPGGFFAHFTDCGDDRRVCGMSALYSLLHLLPEGMRGRLISYEQPVFPEEGNTVTICSMEWCQADSMRIDVYSEEQA